MQKETSILIFNDNTLWIWQIDSLPFHITNRLRSTEKNIKDPSH